MKLLVGLGNPGKKYENNRHNVGCLVTGLLAGMSFGSNLEFKCLRNDRQASFFMNESGRLLKHLIDEYKVHLDHLLLVHDDLDLRIGDYKLQFAKGPRQHNGVLSVEEAVGSEFWRLRVGIDNRLADNRLAGEEYVLQDFTETEKTEIESLVKSQSFFLDVKNWLLKNHLN